MTWQQWILDQALPIVLLIAFFIAIRQEEIYTKKSFGLMKESRDDARRERDQAIEKVDLITKEMADAQAVERAAMLARNAALEAKVAELERQPKESRP